MLPRTPPPAEFRAAPSLPHVHWDLKSARQGAEKSERQIVCIIPEDEARYQAALSYLNTLEGAWLRSIAEVWLAKPGEPSAQAVLDKAEIRSLPVVVQMDAKAKNVEDYIAGSDVAPFDKACRTLLGRENAYGVIPQEKIKSWFGGLDPTPFIAFGQARAKDLSAAAHEPYRHWLFGLVRNPDSNIRLWAATRLVEANAPSTPEDPDAWKLFLQFQVNRFDATIRNQKQDLMLPPWRKLGAPGFITPNAPFWSAIRTLLRGQNAPNIGISIYALMAPVLVANDRDWVLRAFSTGGNLQKGRPWNNTVFWIGTDWLLAYGKPSDWTVFNSCQNDSSWKSALHDVERQVQQIPAYWDTSPTVQDMFCEGETAESFWKNPDACLASWGVTRENLVELGIDQIHLTKGGAFPKYPDEAKQHGFSGILHVRTLVDATGKPLWARPLPGYALCFFAPFGLKYAANSVFEPAKIGGVGRPSQFLFTFPFRLNR